MTLLPYPLVELDAKVFETTELCRVWNLGDPYLGVRVDQSQHKFDELTLRFYFVLPHLSAVDGVVTLLTIARGLPGDTAKMPRFWDPVALRDTFGGVYAHVTYDPATARFSVLMNVGGDSPELLGVTLEEAFPNQVRGRVLDCYVEINKDRIFASVSDRFAEGDLAWDAVAPSAASDQNERHQDPWENGPWGNSPEGYWWITSGVGDTLDPDSSILPPGFGLSDVRITLDSEVDQAVGSLPYQGALDHLVLHRPVGVSDQTLAFLQDIDDIRKIADNLERFSQSFPATSPSLARGQVSTTARK